MTLEERHATTTIYTFSALAKTGQLISLKEFKEVFFFLKAHFIQQGVIFVAALLF